MTWKSDGSSSLLCQALCIISKPSVNSNWSHSPETLNLGQNWWFFFPCDLKIWGMTLRNNRHIFSTTSSFVLHFIAIYQFKMELQSGNTKFGSKSAIFVPCDLEIWRMTLKNNRAPFLCYFKLSVSFHSHSKFSITNKDLKPKKMF